MTRVISVSYQRYRRRLALLSSTANDQSALANLPDQVNDPVMNYPNIWLKNPNARVLGYTLVPVTQDATVTVNVGICNMDRVTIDPAKYVIIYISI